MRITMKNKTVTKFAVNNFLKCRVLVITHALESLIIETKLRMEEPT